MSVYQIPMRGAERDLNKENICRRGCIWEWAEVYIHFEMNIHPCIIHRVIHSVYVGLWKGGVTLASVSCKPGASMMQQITVVISRRMAYLINWNQVIICTMYVHTVVCITIDCLHDPASNGGVAHARAALADRTGCWTKAAEKEKS